MHHNGACGGRGIMAVQHNGQRGRLRVRDSQGWRVDGILLDCAGQDIPRSPTISHNAKRRSKANYSPMAPFSLIAWP